MAALARAVSGTWIQAVDHDFSWHTVSREPTLSLDAEDVRRAKIQAAQRGVSVSRLLSDMLREILDRDSGYGRARERHLAALETANDLGTGGRPGWSRDDLHER